MVLENGLLLAMYSKIQGEFDGYYETTQTYFSIENAEAKACNVNGYIYFDLLNTTGKHIDQCYLKIDLYNEQELLADTEYVLISDMEAESSKKINIKFKANNIEHFYMSMVEPSQVPDKTNIINILGWEIDLSNVFGLDLTNVSIFGIKLTDIFSVQNIKTVGSNAWNGIKVALAQIPWWGYAIATGIILFQMPAFYFL